MIWFGRNRGERKRAHAPRCDSTVRLQVSLVITDTRHEPTGRRMGDHFVCLVLIDVRSILVASLHDVSDS